MNMRNSSMKMSENREYIESNRWKCNQSPSGAHYWIIRSQEMTCKYCHYCKPLYTTEVGCPNPETSK
jgi:hypothetical protein